MTPFIIGGGLLVFALLFYCFPLLRPKRPALPVLYLEVSDCPTPNSQAISWKKTERLLALLATKQFQTVLPSELAKPLPSHPVLIVFANGYQSYAVHLLSLLEKYQFRAAISLPVAAISQYDKWEENGPWQNILTPAQLTVLQKSGQIEFISQGMEPLSTVPADKQMALWQLTESKNRLQTIYKIPVQMLLFPITSHTNSEIWTVAQQEYSYCIGPRSGNNPLPLSSFLLKIFVVSPYTCLRRLVWKLPRP